MKLPHFLQRRPVVVRLLVVCALVALAWTGYSAYRRANLPKDCVSRLALVDEAITRWATKNNQDVLAIPTEAELAKYLDDRSLLHCPDGGTYVLGTRVLATTCSKHGHASVVFMPPPQPSAMNDIVKWLSSHFSGPRYTGTFNSCIANLKQIDGATRQWAFEHNKQETDSAKPGELAGADLYMRSFPICLEGGKYILRSVKESPCCTVVGHTL